MFELGLFVLSLAVLVVVLVLAHQLLGADVLGGLVRSLCKAMHAAYAETKALIGTLGRRGWRPYIPWCFGALFTVLIYRVAMGLPLPDAMTLGVLLGPMGALTAHCVQVRSAEYRAGVANDAPTSSPMEGRVGPWQTA